MKIAYISDLHLEHTDPSFPNKIDALFQANRADAIIKAYDLPDAIAADVLVIAGDLHHDAFIRTLFIDALESHYELPVLFVPGNHCCHYNTLKRLNQAPELRIINGVSFGMATLWTQLSPLDQLKALQFIDMQLIKGMDLNTWNRLHKEHLNTLIAWAPDIIVTHHAPFEASISDGYANHPFNVFFANGHISPLAFPKTKLWIHGHVHQNHDYMMGDIHVVCNPKGYYFEKRPTIINFVEV